MPANAVVTQRRDNAHIVSTRAQTHFGHSA